tara:strand:- start:11140 stop:13107 length:1968 start_codon:yes stop_codon:yes gene_type:complete
VAIPIKLITGDKSIIVDLEAQSVDMAIDRNVSAFPTPANILKRFAVDTNIPRITMEINGILIDDDGVDISGISNVDDAVTITPMRTLINFGSFMNTEPFDPAQIVDYGNRGGYPDSITAGSVYKVNTNHVKGSTSTIVGTSETFADAIIRQGTTLEFSSNYSTGTTGALNLTDSIFSTVDADSILSKGDRIVKSSGILLGIVLSVTDGTVTFQSALPVDVSSGDTLFISYKCFNYKNEFLGYLDNAARSGKQHTFTLDRSIESNILQDSKISINRSNSSMEEILHKEYIKLTPSYWLEDSSRGPTGSRPLTDVINGTFAYPNYGIKFIFDKTRAHSLAGGSDSSIIKYKAGEVNANGYPHRRTVSSTDASYLDAEVWIPIKDITRTDGKNPAVLLATLVEEAMQLTGTITANSKKLNSAGDEVLYSSGAYTTFRVKRMGSVLAIDQVYRPSQSIEHPPVMSSRFRRMFNPQLFNSSASFSSLTKKSAGDKAQDLIGLVSNANTTKGDLFQGIQIPYDSLITSSGVTGMARNFFLTFGEIAASEKGALANTRSASESINNLSLTGDAGGNKSDRGENKDNLLTNWAKSIIPDEVESLVGFLTNTVSDMFVTLSTGAHGNDGGIRIMPEKLHVRYDAGNNYYAYNLLLVATDFVIGV